MSTSNSLQFLIWLNQKSKDIFSSSKCKVTFGFKYIFEITFLHVNTKIMPYMCDIVMAVVT